MAITKAMVLNLTEQPEHLLAFGGDSVTVLPSISHTPVPVAIKFVTWIKHHEDVIRILYYMDDLGKRYEVDSPEVAALTNPQSEPAATAQPQMQEHD